MQQQDGLLQQAFGATRRSGRRSTCASRRISDSSSRGQVVGAGENDRAASAGRFRPGSPPPTAPPECRPGEGRAPCRPGTGVLRRPGLRRRTPTARISTSLPPSNSRHVGAPGFVRRHDQQFPGARLQGLVDRIEGGVQVVLGDRFFQVGHGAQGQAAPAVFVAGDDVHRNVPRRGIVLQPIENRPAGHVGQGDIERDGAGVELAREGERGGAAQRDQRLDAAIVRQVDQDAGEGDVVLDDQQDRIAGVNQVAVVVDFDVVHHDGGRGRWRRQDHVHDLVAGRVAIADHRPRPARRPDELRRFDLGRGDLARRRSAAGTA